MGGGSNGMQWAGMPGSTQMAASDSNKAQEQQQKQQPMQQQQQQSKPQESNTKATAAPAQDESPWGPPVGLAGAVAWSPFGQDAGEKKQANGGDANAWTAMFNPAAAGNGNGMQWAGMTGSAQMATSDSSMQHQLQPSTPQDANTKI